MRTDYKNCEIVYMELSNTWAAYDGSDKINIDACVSMSDAKRVIDKHLAKLKGVAQKIPIVMLDRWSKKPDVSGVATSVADRSQVWVNINGRRSKESMSSVFLDTPENRAQIAEWQEAHKRADALYAALPRIAAEDFQPEAKS